MTIRIGELVKIVEPYIFRRCGYPLTKEIVKSEFTDTQRKSIDLMLKEFKIYREEFIHRHILGNISIKGNQDTYDSIVDILSSAVLRLKQWGGNERMIYSDYDPSLKEMVGTVWGKRVVKTGTYTRGWSDEPAYLENEQTHIILKLSHPLILGKEFEIQQKYVDKI